MPKPRKQQISLDATPYYHCISRCVRRAFLCGTDTANGQSYEYRRGWLEEKLLVLPQTFAINIAAEATWTPTLGELWTVILRRMPDFP